MKKKMHMAGAIKALQTTFGKDHYIVVSKETTIFGKDKREYVYKVYADGFSYHQRDTWEKAVSSLRLAFLDSFNKE